MYAFTLIMYKIFVKKAYIKQPAGLGDIFFLQKAVYVLSNQYEEFYYPINDHFSFLKDYLIAPYCKLLTESEFINDGTFDCIDLNHTNGVFPGGIMKSKYNSLGIDYSDWQNYFEFKRNYVKEVQLLKVLNIEPGEKIAVRSNKWGSYPMNVLTKPLNFSTDLRIVDVEFIDGFNIFDWLGVFEQASEIYMIETSFNYILEKIDLTGKDLYLWSRHSVPNFWEFDGIFLKPWIKIID